MARLSFTGLERPSRDPVVGNRRFIQTNTAREVGTADMFAVASPYLCCSVRPGANARQSGLVVSRW